MIDFTSLIVEKWGLSENVATDICTAYEKGDSVFYLVDYIPHISAELDSGTLGAVFDCLDEIAGLSSKKKRVANALKKAGEFDKEAEHRVAICTSSTELDDMLLPYRSNSRSRAQQAIKKGLGPFADIIDLQEVEDKSIEDIAKDYVGKDSSLKTVDDVLAGVKDILVERFAYDETVRQMVREFGYEDGYLEVTPKNKKDKEFLSYRGRLIAVNELAPEELSKLLLAEKSKRIRLKYGVQLFRITELLRQHFIENPDSVFFDFLCEIIDECWSRMLQSVVEKYAKTRMHKRVEDWALMQITVDFEAKTRDAILDGTLVSLAVAENNDLVVVAFGATGSLVGATRENRKRADVTPVSNRLKQFCARYRPSKIIVLENDLVDQANEIIEKTLHDGQAAIEIVSLAGNEGLLTSPWMAEECSDLDEDMRAAYAAGLVFLQPLSLVPQIGFEHFSVHPLQNVVTPERLMMIIERKSTELMLHKGVPYLQVVDSVLQNVRGIKAETLAEIRKQGGRKPFATKNDLLSVKGVDEIVFRNIAGYIVLPNGETALDRTLVHPDLYEWVGDIAGSLGISVETLISNPEQIRSLAFDDFAEKVFADKKLILQLAVGQQYAGAVATKQRRRLRLSEVEEGTIVSGRVTNVTAFGVFVDINAACDGLVHISQLADGYVETPEQVVHQGEQVDVRVIKVDSTKKRVSLSMKNLGDRGPKVRPSTNQLSNLADHFKNR